MPLQALDRREHNEREQNALVALAAKLSASSGNISRTAENESSFIPESQFLSSVWDRMSPPIQKVN
jgi:hypothetical protein